MIRAVGVGIRGTATMRRVLVLAAAAAWGCTPTPRDDIGAGDPQGDSARLGARYGDSGYGATAAETARGTALDAAERRFIADAAMGNLAEIELGRLAMQTASNEQVKQFGQRMVDEHGKANDELAKLAEPRGITLPVELVARQETLRENLGRLSGEEFDRAYLRLMAENHSRDLARFEKMARTQGSPVGAFAARMMQTLREHLATARDLSSMVRENARS